MLSKRISALQESPTLALNAKVKALDAEGKDVVNFTVGEPDFRTPANVIEAAKRALDEGFTRYTPASGIPELKDAICAKFKKDNRLDYKRGDIIVSNGGKQALSNAIQAICDKGDEIILPIPYWVSYVEQIRIAEGVPIFLNFNKDFQFNVDGLKDRINKKTKAVILNYPNNPSGAVYPKTLLKKVADVVIEKNLYVISDEVYEKFNYGGEHVSIASLNEEIRNKTVVINAVSKTYAMTGFRIGYAAAPAEIIKPMSNLQSQETSNPCSIAQKAALEALTGPQDFVKKMVNEFKKRRDFVVKRLNQIDGIACFRPEGAFYVFPDISKFGSSSEFSKDLLDKKLVGVVPGSEFGSDRHIRISYGTSMEQIEKGIERIREFCEEK